MDAVKTGTLIAETRKERNLTQKDLAQSLHISVQAVSKWERGLNFPDIALLEPLAELLGLTVSELLSGERDAAPGEELVRSSLRASLEQLGGRIKKWRGLFFTAAAVLLCLGLWSGYVWVRDNTEWLPQKETVIRPLAISDQARLAASVAGDSSLYLFDLDLADDFRDYSLWLEFWTPEGLSQSWELAKTSGAGNSLYRHQSLAFTYNRGDRNGLSCLNYGFGFLGSRRSGTLTDVPYLSSNRGYGLTTLSKPVEVSPDHGAVLLCFILDPDGQGLWQARDWTGAVAEPIVEEGEAFLLLRLRCEQEGIS